MLYSLIRLIVDKIRENFRTLIFWPCFGVAFFLVEQINRNPWQCHEMYCKWDDYIPFCEYFVIAYIMWFVYMAGTIVYLIFKDVDAYKTTMKFIIISFSVTIVIYLLFPTAQLMRPHDYPQDNVFMDMVRWFYRHDTPTNVCPSLHVIGTLATMYGALTSKRLMGLWRGMRSAYVIVGSFICVSTVFLKQHSLVDVVIGVLLCAVIWAVAMRRGEEATAIDSKEEKRQEVA